MVPKKDTPKDSSIVGVIETLRKEVHRLQLRVAHLETEHVAIHTAIMGTRPSLPTSVTQEGSSTKMIFRNMSPRHHAALQMILRGASNKEIGDRFGVGEAGAKTYTNGLYKHLGLVGKGPSHNKRHWFVTVVKPIFDSIDRDEYLQISRIPKNWDADYAKIGKKYQVVFDSAGRVKKKGS